MERVKIDVCCVMTSSLFSRDRGTQENLGEPRTTQENPEELRRTQDNLREPRRTQENPRELRGTQENSGNLRRTQENSGEPRRVHDLWRGRFWLADPTSWRLHGDEGEKTVDVFIWLLCSESLVFRVSGR